MASMLSDDELREKYKDIIENDDLISVTRWTEANKADPTDEDAFREKVLSEVEVIAQKIVSAVN